jgi:ATP-binding cassette subfamily B protein
VGVCLALPLRRVVWGAAVSDPSAPSSRRSVLVVRALRLHAELAPGLMGLWLLTLVGAIVLPVASLVLVGVVVGAAVQGPSHVLRPLLALGFVELLAVPCNVYGWVTCWMMGRRYRLAHRERIMRALLAPPGIAHIHAPRTLDAAHAADNAWVVNMLEGVNNVIVSRVTGAGAVLIIARYQPVAAFVLAVSWIVMGTWRWRRVHVTARVMTGQAQTMRRAVAMSDLALLPTAAKELRLFGLRSWLSARYAQEWYAAMREVWAERRSAARGATLVAALLFGGHVVALTLIAQDAAAGAIGIGQLAAVLQGVLLARELGEGVMGQWEVDFGLPLVERIRELEAVVAAASEPMPGVGAPPVPRSAIWFEGVRFRYPGSSRDVIEDLTLEIPVGTSLAIVGENGAGKTTAVQLLARLRDPTSGSISIDGVDLRTFAARDWHRRVAAVSQDALRLPLSVADNVGAGHTADASALEHAADAAGIGDHVRSLPQGWDTPLAKGFDGGADLSGGQWQRLALARGLVALATGAEVLVLDEPTAHLDVRAEAELYGRFLELTRGRTTVLVSHRFSTVRRADRIAVLEHGRVTELGSHEELLAAGGRYAEMFPLQAARFTEPAVSVDEG